MPFMTQGWGVAATKGFGAVGGDDCSECVPGCNPRTRDSGFLFSQQRSSGWGKALGLIRLVWGRDGL